MKILFIISTIVAASAASIIHYRPTTQQLYTHAIPLSTHQYLTQDALGQYSYGYSGDKISKAELKLLDGITRGTYSYIDANGKIQTVKYTADDLHGFQVAATNLPVHEVPEVQPIHDTVEVSQAKEEHLAALREAELRAISSPEHHEQQIIILNGNENNNGHHENSGHNENGNEIVKSNGKDNGNDNVNDNGNGNGHGNDDSHTINEEVMTNGNGHVMPVTPADTTIPLISKLDLRPVNIHPGAINGNGINLHTSHVQFATPIHSYAYSVYDHPTSYLTNSYANNYANGYSHGLPIYLSYNGLNGNSLSLNGNAIHINGNGNNGHVHALNGNGNGPNGNVLTW